MKVSTINQYRASWDDFQRTCQILGVQSLPAKPSTVLEYLAKRSHLSYTTKRKRISAIQHYHRKAGYPTPDLKQTYAKAIRSGRQMSEFSNNLRDVSTLLTPDQRTVLNAIDTESLIGKRDQLLFLLMVGLDLSRQQCADLCFDEIESTGTMLRFGAKALYSTEILTDPVAAFHTWVDQANITSGRLFRSIDRHSNVGDRISGTAVFQIIRKHAKSVNLKMTPMHFRSVPHK